MRDFTLTADDKRDRVEGLVFRYRTGEIGPVVLRSEMRRLGFDDADIDDVRNEHIDACAAAMSQRYGARL